MSTNDHERARRLVTASRVESPSASDERWLRSHLAECAACERFEQTLREELLALRLADVRVEPWLLERTQRRLRIRALAEPEGRLALVASVALAFLGALFAGAGFWLSLRAFAWGGPLAARLALALALWFWPASILAIAATLLGPRLHPQRIAHFSEVRS